MIMQRFGIHASRAVIAFIASFAFALAFTASSAYGAVLECGNGWELEYSESEGLATIEGVSKVGSGTLAIPAKAGESAVAAIGKQAFYSTKADAYAKLTEVEIPEGVTTIGRAAFMNSGLEKVTVPESVVGIPANCFANCASLSSVVFEGASIGYIEEGAFARCTSLSEISIPVLSSYAPNSTYRMKDKVFSGCANLKTVIFQGDANTDVSHYILYANAFEDCPKLENFVYYCKRFNIRRTTGSDDATDTYNSAPNLNGTMKLYQTVRFYASETDAEDASKAVYTITCLDSVLVKDVLSGTVDQAAIWAEEGDKSKIELSGDGIWGLKGAALQGDSEVLDNTFDAVPVTRDNLGYGWVSSAVIDEFLATYEGSSAFSRDYPQYYIDDAGKVAGIDDFVVHAVDGSVVDPSNYDLVFEEHSTVNREDVWTPRSVAAGVGTYRVHAAGKPGTASEGTATEPVEFQISEFTPTIVSFSDADKSRRWGRAANAAAVLVKGSAKSVVVVPSDDWRCQLIGASLAGAAGGVLLIDDGENVSSETINAYLQTKVSALEIVGSTASVPQSASVSSEVYLADYLLNRNPKYQSRYGDDSTMTALADQAYASVKTLAEKDAYDDRYQAYGCWGTTAIVASPERSLLTQPIAQYAYAQKAPVFFIQDDGKLSSVDLGYLKAGGFENVVIAGDASYVSQACAEEIASSCGVTPKRMFDSGADSLEAALNSIGDLGVSLKTVVIASTETVADAASGAALAAARGGVMVPCSSSADAKRIQDYLRAVIAEQGQAGIANVYLVGDFSNVDDTLFARISNMWQNPWSTTIGVGDTVEVGDFVFRLDSASKASYVRLRNVDSAMLVAGVSYNDKSYSVGAPDAGLLAGAIQLKSVTYRASMTSLPASAFEGFKLLKTLDLGPSITSVGSSAFKGCPSLKSVTAPQVKTIGKDAFAGCAALATVAAPGVQTIGQDAFLGCTALTAVAAPGVQTIGQDAFAGCTALASVTAPQVKSIGQDAFAGCTALSAVTAPGVQTIGQGAFAGCAALKSASFANLTSIPADAFKSCSSLASVAGGKVASVGQSAFSGCSKLSSASFSSATSIGASAFMSCTALKSLLAPKAKSLGAKAFFGCSKLSKVSLASLGSIGAGAFKNCKAIRTFSGAKVTAIGDSAFDGCVKMAQATFKSSSLSKIGKQAFNGCKKLKSLTLKTKKLATSKIGASAFAGMPAKALVKVPKAKVKAYKALFVKKGLSKKAKVRAV